MMIRKSHSLLVFLLLILAFTGCRDPFEPELTQTDFAQLVVEGYIEINGKESGIKLSRTRPVISDTDPNMESGATVMLRDEFGYQWDLQESEPGTYSFSGFLSAFSTYQLEIILNNGNRYISDNLTPIITPEIGDVGFQKDENGVDIFISTQGNDQAQYFLWDYEEYWQFKPGIQTVFIYNPETNEVDYRRPDQAINLCWNNNLFPRIILESAGKYTDKRIFQKELVNIPNRSEKLMQRYSIKVRQRAIDRESYDFWEILRKNSDDIGGIFSPLPSLIQSNISSLTDPEENVIGFVSMGQSAEKRIYINVADVFPWPFFIPEYEFCQIENDTTFISAYSRKFSSGNLIPARPIMSGTTTIGYLGAPVACTDCTLRGSNVRPDFWED